MKNFSFILMIQNQRIPIAKCSAPAKIIISGEHSVVYGHNALVAAVDIRTYCELTQMADNCRGVITFELINIKQAVQCPIQYISIEEVNCSKLEYATFVKSENHIQNVYMYKIAKFFNYACAHKIITSQEAQVCLNLLKKRCFVFRVDSEIGVAKGLGSSAALSVCIAGCLFKLTKHLLKSQIEVDKDHINQLSLEYEKIYHTNPSGIDNYISTYGGLLKFNKNKNLNQPISWKLKLKIGVIDSGVEKNTKHAVMYVRQLHQSTQEAKNYIIAISLITQKLLQLVQHQQQQHQQFFALIQENHELLKQLGLSNPKIESLVERFNTKSSRAKITGSGMGGCVAVFSEKDSDIQVKWSEISQTGLQYH